MSADNKTAIEDVRAPDLNESDGGDAAVSRSEMKEATVELPQDQVFEMVKNERRRLAIDYLRQHPEKTTLSDLAEHIAAIENNKSIKEISSKERKRVYVGLYQCHLPKMDDLDVVEFNQDRGWVTLGPNADRLFPYINADDDDTVGLAPVYLGLSCLGGLLLAVSVLSGAAVGVLVPVITGLLVCSVAACSLFQLRRRFVE